MTTRPTLQERLSGKHALIGLLQTHPNPALAEMAGMCGYDFLVIDNEHGLFTERDHVHTLHAITATGMAAFVRLNGHDTQAVGRYLDMGADGIVAPNVTTADQANALVRAMEYPPEGIRGFGAAAHRGTRYGLDLAEHLNAPRAGAALLVIIESAKGVANVEDILSIEGVDAVLVGPSDLSANLGRARDFSHPRYAAALARIEQAATARGKILASAPHPGYPLERLLASGHRLFIIGADMPLIRQALSAELARAKAAW